VFDPHKPHLFLFGDVGVGVVVAFIILHSGVCPRMVRRSVFITTTGLNSVDLIDYHLLTEVPANTSVRHSFFKEDTT
jgi:hypothetical protein